MIVLMKFWPAIMAVVVSVLNAMSPEIAKLMAEHPDILVNVSSLLTVIANAINPRPNQPTTIPPKEGA